MEKYTWYTNIKFATDKNKVRVPLPTTIGKSGMCHVIVNVPLSSFPKLLLTVQNGNVQFMDEKTGTTIDQDQVTGLGLSISKPFRVLNEKRFSLKDFASFALEKERQIFEKFSPKAKKYLGSSFSQKSRLAIWSLAMVIISLTGGLLKHNFAPEVTLADTPITLEMNRIYASIVGASPTRKGYEKGAMFHISLEESQVKNDLLLRFKTTGIDSVGETKFFFNSKLIYQPTFENLCPKDICDIQVSIPADQLKAGRNELQLVHTKEASPYMIKDIFISDIPEPTTIEMQGFDRNVALAKRFYDERGIISTNINNAMNSIANSLRFIAARKFPEQVRQELLTFKDQIVKTRTEMIADLWRNFHTKSQLKRYDDAVQVLGELDSLVSENDGEDKSKIEKLREELKEVVR